MDEKRPGWSARRGLGIVALLACASLGARATEITLAANAQQPGNLPILVADRQGYFAAEGLTVKMLSCAFGKLCLRMVTDGRAQFGTVADLPIAVAVQSGERVAVLATLSTHRNDTKIVTRRSAGIRRAADLTGRVVGLHLGTTAQYALESLLVIEGADPRRLNVVDLQPGEGRTRLLARSIDAAALFEPYAFEAVQALGEEAVVIDTERIYTQTWNLVAGTGPKQPTPSQSEALLRALDRAITWIASYPAEAQALLRERSQVDAEFVAAQWPMITFGLTLDQALLTTLEAQSRWALRSGLSRSVVPNFLLSIRSAPLRRVRPPSVGIVE